MNIFASLRFFATTLWSKVVIVLHCNALIFFYSERYFWTGIHDATEERASNVAGYQIMFPLRQMFQLNSSTYTWKHAVQVCGSHDNNDCNIYRTDQQRYCTIHCNNNQYYALCQWSNNTSDYLSKKHSLAYAPSFEVNWHGCFYESDAVTLFDCKVK